MTKLAEVSLSIKYRKKGEDGEYYGGPMHYIKNGLGKKWAWLASIYAVALLLLVLCDAAFVQVNTAATALDDAFGVPLVVTGIAIAVVSLFVVLGGTQRIGKFCSVMVPPMCVIYIVACLIIICMNADHLGHALGMVFTYAFKPMSAVGGFAGSTVLLTMTKGGFRGIFSNEAGEGTAATVHATAKTDHPVHQGFYGVVEVFIDTIIICSLTGLSILCVGDGTLWAQVGSNGEQLTGVYLTFAAFRDALGPIGVGVMGICVFLFAYSSYLGFFVEFRTSLEYVFNEKIAKVCKWVFFIPPIISCTLPVTQIWDLADMVVGFIFIPNMIALLALSPQVFEMLKEYTAKCKAERKELE
jgi:alanine or glycine:cation symporter, AGCS family